MNSTERLADLVIEVLTVSEIAESLRLPRRRVLSMLARRELPGFRLGRSWRILPDELDAWMRRQTSSGTIATYWRLRG